MARGDYAVFIEGIPLSADEIDERIVKSATRAINKTADRARTEADRQIRAQVNFPANYLAPSQKRLFVSQKASEKNPEARITGRQKATSLARFVSGSAKKGAGVTVQVKPGKSVELPKAFLIKLKRGRGSIETAFNMGLAVRLRPGESLRHKAKAIKSQKGLYLLYGPSVDQVFATVRDDISPETADFLEREFSRLLEL